MSEATVLITGNTYPVKDAIKALGGRWDGGAKGWLVPAAKAEQARKLVAGAGPSTYTPARGGAVRGGRRATRTGCSCGSVEEYEKSSDCWSCKHDR